MNKCELTKGERTKVRVINYGGYMILLTCGILGIFRYKKSEVNRGLSFVKLKPKQQTNKQRNVKTFVTDLYFRFSEFNFRKDLSVGLL